MSAWTDVPPGVDIDEPLSPPKLAALFPWLRPRALDDALRHGPRGEKPRVTSTQGPRPRDRRLTPRSFLDDCRALPTCTAYGCELPALRHNNACGIKGHGHLGRTHEGASERISAAKAGVRQVALEPDELTLTEAIAETGHSHQALTAGCGSGKLRHRIIARPGGQSDVIVFRRGWLAEDLANCPCIVADCENAAPGKSDRCGDHAARGKPAVWRVCSYRQCRSPILVHVSRLRERAVLPGDVAVEFERGHYCNAECRNLEMDEAYGPDYLAGLNPDGATEHFNAIAAGAKAEGKVGTVRAAWAAGVVKSTVDAAYRRGEIEGDLVSRAGGSGSSERIEFDAATIIAWDKGRPGDNNASRRLNAERSAAKGTTMGPHRVLRDAEVVVAHRLQSEKGLGYRRITNALNSKRHPDHQVSFMAVRDALHRYEREAAVRKAREP